MKSLSSSSESSISSPSANGSMPFDRSCSSPFDSAFCFECKASRAANCLLARDGGMFSGGGGGGGCNGGVMSLSDVVVVVVGDVIYREN